MEWETEGEKEDAYSRGTDEDPWRADERHAYEAAEHLDDIMDAFHGLPEGTTRNARERAERTRQMAYGNAYARDAADSHGMGHGGWGPGVELREVGKGDRTYAMHLLTTRHLLDALTRAGLGDFPEPTRFRTEPPEGSVLRWQKTFKRGPEHVYTYVATRVSDGLWYLTGKTDHGIEFEDLVKLIGDSPCELATEWAEIPQLPESVTDGMTPSEWYLAMFPRDTVDGDQGQEG